LSFGTSDIRLGPGVMLGFAASRLSGAPPDPTYVPPDGALTLASARQRNRLVCGQATGEAALDQRPAQRVVGIALGQSPYGVQVIRQHHLRDDLERMSGLGQAKGGAKRVDMLGEQALAVIGQPEGEKERAARHESASIVHLIVLDELTWRNIGQLVSKKCNPDRSAGGCRLG